MDKKKKWGDGQQQRGGYRRGRGRDPFKHMNWREPSGNDGPSGAGQHSGKIFVGGADQRYGLVPWVKVGEAWYCLLQASVSDTKFDFKVDPLRGKVAEGETPVEAAVRKGYEESFGALDLRGHADAVSARGTCKEKLFHVQLQLDDGAVGGRPGAGEASRTVHPLQALVNACASNRAAAVAEARESQDRKPNWARDMFATLGLVWADKETLVRLAHQAESRLPNGVRIASQVLRSISTFTDHDRLEPICVQQVRDRPVTSWKWIDGHVRNSKLSPPPGEGIIASFNGTEDAFVEAMALKAFRYPQDFAHGRMNEVLDVLAQQLGSQWARRRDELRSWVERLNQAGREVQNDEDGEDDDRGQMLPPRDLMSLPKREDDGTAAGSHEGDASGRDAAGGGAGETDVRAVGGDHGQPEEDAANDGDTDVDRLQGGMGALQIEKP